MASEIIVINAADNVGVAVSEIPGGSQVAFNDEGGFSALEKIPAGHKIALCNIASGSEVIKYGHGIGKVKEDVKQGQWVHIHNMIIIEEEQ